MSLLSILKKFGMFRRYDLFEISDAETENVLRDHTIAMIRAESTTDRIKQAQGKLSETIQLAKSASESVKKAPDAMAQLVHDMRSAGHHHTRN